MIKFINLAGIYFRSLSNFERISENFRFFLTKLVEPEKLSREINFAERRFFQFRESIFFFKISRELKVLFFIM